METDLERLIKRRSYNDSSLSLTCPVILTQSWAGLEINPILEIPIMKIAKNLYQPAELTWSIASTISMRSNRFSVDSQSHLPHTGRPEFGLDCC